MNRWRALFEGALHQTEIIGVAATVTAHLGRTPTRAEMNAARRAAHRYAAAGNAQIIRVPVDRGARTLLVLARPGSDVTEAAAHRAATLQATPGRRRTPNPTALLARIERAVETAATDARQLETSPLDPGTAAQVAAALDEPLAELSRLRARLRRRANPTNS